MAAEKDYDKKYVHVVRDSKGVIKYIGSKRQKGLDAIADDKGLIVTKFEVDKKL